MKGRGRYRAGAAALGAWLGLSAGAAAESSVVLYGTVDAGVYKLARGPVSVGNIQRSYWGIKGVEDLGGGYAALFHLQSRFEIDSGRLEASGAGPLFYGESTVGLSGPFGKLRLGRAMTPLWALDWQFDPWANFDRVASIAWQIYHPSYRADPYRTGAAGDYSRVNNGVFYDSPVLAGWSAHLSVNGERSQVPDGNGAVERRRGLAGAVNYEGGGWTALASAERNSVDDRTYFLGLAYGPGATRIMVSANLTELSPFSQMQLGEPRRRRTSAMLAAVHRTGAVTWKAGIGRDFQGYGTEGATGYASLGVSYAWSPRTLLYAGLGHARPGHLASRTNVGLGMNHSF
ncbi:Outer membrane porin protein 32 precursor [Pigmentiphaga humi]|uniref:Outer membrane porin protein 32 n=1 Tax=Pigmentiphaga humi TaxID=2478468 RepID=A0A3P4AZD1_9BURK|nr:porin [Pigmentiphaga humi]VCU68758.1 Outer membrane porin protein 32 precursor [Pigmentiphaga humi]